jgi:hypothetical protein
MFGDGVEGAMMQPKRKDILVFGLVWAAILLVVAVHPVVVLSDVDALRWWALAVGLMLGVVSVVWPKSLIPLFRVWMKFGEMLGGVTSRVILVTLFFALFTPMSFVIKLMRKDLLSKHIDAAAASYWIRRETQPVTFKNQF